MDLNLSEFNCISCFCFTFKSYRDLYLLVPLLRLILGMGSEKLVCASKTIEKYLYGADVENKWIHTSTPSMTSFLRSGQI